MTEHHRAALVRAAGGGTMRREDVENALLEGYARGFTAGVDWSAGQAYEAGRNDAEEELAAALEAGILDQARTDAEAHYRTGYRDALADNRAVVEKLRRRLTEGQA